VTYRELVYHLRDGGAMPVQTIMHVLAQDGRTPADLLAALHGPGRAPRSGDRCECGGRLRTVGTRRRAGRVIRFLACGSCHRPAGKDVTRDSNKLDNGLAGPGTSHVGWTDER